MPFNADKYRAAAKQAAWYNEQDDPNPNYNPFRKTRSRPKDSAPADEENALQPPPTNRSESQLASSIELSRRELNQSALRQPKHADTMPSASQPAYQPSSQPSSPLSLEQPADEKPAEERQTSVKDFSRDHDTSQDSGATSNTVVASEEKSEVKEGKSRRRFTKRFPFVSKPAKEKDAEKSPDVKKTRTRSSLWGKETQKFTVMSQLRATLFNSWINVLLIFVPIGIAVNFANIPKVGVFVINFIAIIPLAAMLSYATEEIALRTGETIGGLLNATFG